MPYEVQTWADKNPSFPLSAARMNHIEAGIAAAAAASVNVKEFGVTGNGATDDSTHFQEALNAGKESAVFVPSSGSGYLLASGLTLPAATTLEGMDKWRAILRTNSKTAFLLKIGGQNELSKLRFEATNLQTAGGALDLSEGAQSTLVDLTFGSNFFLGLNIAGAASPGNINLQRLAWSEAGSGVTGTGICIKIGDGSHLTVGVWASDIYMLGKEASAIAQAIEYNYCDSCRLANALIQTVTKAVTTGNTGGATQLVTGLKISDCVVDTVTNEGIDLGLVLEAQVIGNNVQGALVGIRLRTEKSGGPATATVRIVGNVIQRCVSHGILSDGLTVSGLDIESNQVISNNTANGAEIAGIRMVQGTKEFRIVNNTVGNVATLPGGHQKKGIWIEKGEIKPTNKYQVLLNRVFEDGTDTKAGSGLVDEGQPGTEKLVEKNSTF